MPVNLGTSSFRSLLAPSFPASLTSLPICPFKLLTCILIPINKSLKLFDVDSLESQFLGRLAEWGVKYLPFLPELAKWASMF
eukprot:2409087-Pyramimonas_sp.AAC.1